MHLLSIPALSVTVLAACTTLPACSSNYHPEYHPVTVSNFSQNIAYPAPSTGSGSPPPSIVYAPPAPQTVVAVPAPVDAPPPDFFR